MKNYGLTWWITEIIGLLLLIAIVVFEIYINYSLFINHSVTLSQKVVNITGIVLICYGWSLGLDWLVKKIRKSIRKHIK